MMTAAHNVDTHASSGCEDKMDVDGYGRLKGEPIPELRPDAPAFVPQDFKLPPKLKTSRREGGKKGDVYKVLDAVPFTPSQGIRTPSPNNMASLRWQLYSPFTRFSPDSPRSMLCNFSGVPSDSSSSDTSATQPASPMHTMAPPASVYSPFMFCPLGFTSPAPSFNTADPGSPMAPSSPLLPGSPVSTPRGAAFSTFTAAPYGSSHFAPFGPLYSVQSVPSTLPSDCIAANTQFIFTEPAFKPTFQAFPPPPFPMASPFTAVTPDRQPPPYPAFPPQRPELTSAFQTAPHHLQPMLHCASSLPQPGSRFIRHRGRLARSMELPPEMDLESASSLKTKFKQRKSSSDPRPGADGQPRLNARQRRTLRRAKERALKALTETSQKMLAKAGVAAMPEDPGTPVSSHSNSTSATAMNASPSRSPGSDSGEGSNFGDKDDGKYDDIDNLDISDLIQQLQVRADEGLVDEKLVRDLQIIQGLLGALKQPVPLSKPATAKSRLSRLTVGSDSSGTHSQSPSPTPM